MVGTRKAPTKRSTVTLGGSPVIEAVNEDNAMDTMDQLSVDFLSFLFSFVDFLGTVQFYTTILERHIH